MPAANASVSSALPDAADTSGTSWRPSDRLYAGLLVGASLAAAGVRFNDQLIGLTGDNAQYVLLSQALLTGKPYANAEYPWGYPAIIAPILAFVGPQNLTTAIPWLKLLTLALFLVSVLLVYMVLRPGKPSLAAFGAAFLYAINGTAILYANDIMTEIPYSCATFGAILFWQRRVEPCLTERAYKVPWPTLLVAGAFIGLCYYLRTVGIALMAAAFVALLLRRRVKRGVAMAALLLLIALPWLVFSSSVDQPNYVSKLLLRDPYNPSLGSVASVWEFITRTVDSAILYMNGVFPAMLLPPPASGGFRDVIALLFIALGLAGFVRHLKLGPNIREIYVLFFLFILFAWPWKADRFLLPVYPLLVFYVLDGGRLLILLTSTRRPLSARVLRAGALAALLLIALPNLWVAGEAGAANVSYLQGKSAPEGRTPDWQAYFAACEWLRLNTPPGSIIISRKSTLTTIYAERPSVLIPLIPPDQYAAFIERNNVAYILEDGFAWSTQTRDYLRPALTANSARVRLVYTTGPVVTRIWHVQR